jgi:hypothetical protein
MRETRSQEARLKPLGSPRNARVVVDGDGTPVTVTVEKSRARAKRVTVVRERWRIDDEWWRHQISREYLTVVLEDGRSLTLYMDLVRGEWWIQGEES